MTIKLILPEHITNTRSGLNISMCDENNLGLTVVSNKYHSIEIGMGSETEQYQNLNK